MSYYSAKTVNTDFEAAIAKVTEELMKEQFGVVTEIDMQAALKDKLDLDVRKYKILGACNPPFAYEAIGVEDHVGLMLPCNVVVQEKENGEVIVSAVDPVASMLAIQNVKLEASVQKIRTKMKKVIDSL